MSQRCVFKDEKGEQCSLVIEAGLFCETHRHGKSTGGSYGGTGNVKGPNGHHDWTVAYNHPPRDHDRKQTNQWDDAFRKK